MSISQLTGPQYTGRGKARQQNVTIQGLPPLVVDATLRTAVESAVTTAIDAAAFALPARNKSIAHIDAKTMLDPSAPKVRLGSRRQVNIALDKIAEVLNVLNRRYENSETRFRMGDMVAGADTLLFHLKAGLDAEEEKRRELFLLYQGAAGVLLTGAVGFTLAMTYIFSQKSLPFVMLIHGFIATIGIVELFLGVQIAH